MSFRRQGLIAIVGALLALSLTHCGGSDGGDTNSPADSFTPPAGSFTPPTGSFTPPTGSFTPPTGSLTPPTGPTSPTVPPPQVGESHDFEGVWAGTVTSASGTKLDTIALALPNGVAYVVTIGNDASGSLLRCDLHVGAVTVSGNSISADFASYTGKYCVNVIDEPRENWSTAVGPVSSLSATGTFTKGHSATLLYSAAWGDKGQLDLAYDPSSTIGSSLSMVTGNYSGLVPTVAAAIDAAGRISGQGFTVVTGTGGESPPVSLEDRERRDVAYAGQLAVVDGSKNYYRLTLTRTETQPATSVKTFDGYAFVVEFEEPVSWAGSGSPIVSALLLVALQRGGTEPLFDIWLKY